MDLIKVIETFPDQEACIAYLERLKWAESPECPHCESTHVKRRNECAIGRIGRWNCHDCRATFKVTHGTLFHGEPENTAPKVVSRYRSHGKRKEKFVVLSVSTRFRLETKDGLVYTHAYPCGNGG
ncbi:MAG: transposase [Candidatus Poribacteria bacterium]|nr:transposase [Candidatus Poribacteria bacterium]